MRKIAAYITIALGHAIYGAPVSTVLIIATSSQVGWGSVIGWAAFFSILFASDLGSGVFAFHSLERFKRYVDGRGGVDSFSCASDSDKREAQRAIDQINSAEFGDDVRKVFPIPEEQLLILRQGGMNIGLGARAIGSQASPFAIIILPDIKNMTWFGFLLRHELIHNSFIGWQFQKWSSQLQAGVIFVLGLLWFVSHKPAFLLIIAILATYALVGRRVAPWLEEVICDCCAYLSATKGERAEIEARCRWHRVESAKLELNGKVAEGASNFVVLTSLLKVLFGKLRFKLFTLLVIWLRDVTNGEKPLWSQVMWAIAKLAGTMPLAIGIFFVFCISREPAPGWIRWLAIITAILYWFRRRSMLRSFPYLVVHNVGDLLRKDPACWEVAAHFTVSNEDNRR
jgi:hypothetical protein